MAILGIIEPAHFVGTDEPETDVYFRLRHVWAAAERVGQLVNNPTRVPWHGFPQLQEQVLGEIRPHRCLSLSPTVPF